MTTKADIKHLSEHDAITLNLMVFKLDWFWLKLIQLKLMVSHKKTDIQNEEEFKIALSKVLKRMEVDND